MIVNGVIAFVIYLIVSNIPPVEPLTDTGIQVLGIILGLIYGLITMEPAIPSIAALILMGTTGYTNVMGAFMSGGGHYAVVMVLGLMMIGGIMNYSGLAHALAERIINSKLATGRPWALSFLILLAAMIPSMFLTAIPVLIIVWDIIRNIFEIVGFKKGDKWPALMMAGITGSTAIGMSAMPFSMGVSTDFGIFMSLFPDAAMPAIPFMGTSLLICVAFVVLELVVLRFIFRPDISNLKNYTAPERNAPFNTNQKRGLALLIIFVVVALLPDILPDGTPFQIFMSGCGVIGASFFVVFLALLIRNKDGSPFITMQQIADNGIFWSLLAMIAALMVVCGSITDPSLGISPALANLLSPMVRSVGPFGVYAILLAIALIGTNLLDNAVIGMALAAVISMIAQDLAIPAVGVFCMLLHAAEYGVLLPVSSPLAAMTYGQTESGWLDRKTIVFTGVAFMAVIYVVLLFIGYPMLGILK